MVFQGFVDAYNRIIESGDARSNEYPFVRDPVYVVSAVILYLVIVIGGPRLMAKREPFQFRGLLIFYNFLSVVLSIYMMWEFFRCSFLNPNFNLFCEPINENDRSPMTLGLVEAHWLYFFSKFIEFLDTFFFVLRKKNNQISFLHVYHHCSMLVLQWMLVKYVPGGASYFGPLCNCFIHTLMYAYYMLSAFGPHMQKYLWWKKYLTRMQMIQFVTIIAYFLTLHKLGCINWLEALHIVYLLTLLYLFGMFYLASYTQKRRIAAAKKDDSSNHMKKED